MKGKVWVTWIKNACASEGKAHCFLWNPCILIGFGHRYYRYLEVLVASSWVHKSYSSWNRNQLHGRYFLFNPFSFFLFFEDATLQHGLACNFSCVHYRSIGGAVVFLRQWLILKYLITVDRDVLTLLRIKDCLFILCLISVYPHFVYGLHFKQEKGSYRNPRARLSCLLLGGRAWITVWLFNVTGSIKWSSLAIKHQVAPVHYFLACAMSSLTVKSRSECSNE